MLNSPRRSFISGKILDPSTLQIVVKVIYYVIIVVCSTTSDFVLRAAPHISEDYENQASKIRIAFTGDPSFFAYNGEEEEPEPEDPDAPPVERFREVHRLTYTVKVSFLPLSYLIY